MGTEHTPGGRRHFLKTGAAAGLALQVGMAIAAEPPASTPALPMPEYEKLDALALASAIREGRGVRTVRLRGSKLPARPRWDPGCAAR